MNKELIDKELMGKEISPYQHIIYSHQFGVDFLKELFDLTDKIKKNPLAFKDELQGKTAAMLFYEASTRTRMSFESAMIKLGGSCITTENASQFSSATKGETLEDTIRVISNYADFIILRHYEDTIDEVTKVSDIPIINAGSGKAYHPTQTLLDTYTIESYFSSLSNLNITIVGDLLRGRTCNSLIHLMSKFSGNKFFFVSPPNSKASPTIKAELKEKNISFFETEEIEEVLEQTDICYVTRIQKERFHDPEEYEQAKGKIVLNTQNINLLKSTAIILHPLPRVDEISPEIDSDPRAKYFEQVKNGLYVRMALFKILHNHKK